MEFVQYNKLRFDYLLGGIVWSVATVLMGVGLFNAVPEISVWTVVLLLAVMVFTCADLFWEWHKEKQKVIRIDETGISLKKKGTLEWAFSWDEIQRIGRCGPYRHGGICFVPKNPLKIDLWTVCAPYKFEFHLNKTAKEALERYCKLPIHK